MVTREEAVTARDFVHAYARNADGTPQRFRRNGATKTWKSKGREHEFRIPVKRGLREYTYITHTNANEWAVSYA